MPSRPIVKSSSAAPYPTQLFPHHHHHHHRSHSLAFLPPLGAATAAFSFLLLFAICFRKISRKRCVPSDAAAAKPPHRFSYSALRDATSSFSPSLRLGQGGFGSVFRGTLPDGHLVAVKAMEAGSLQGEREFHNELFFASKLDSCHVITALGFSSDRKHKTMLLIYELMPNGNLQDALLHRKCPELTEWKRRFSIAVDIARGVEYLHGLDPPVIHGDIKPSNVLLDGDFNPKIADFGLAWLKTDAPDQNKMEEKVVKNGDVSESNDEVVSAAVAAVEDYGSVVETESVTTGFEDFNLGENQSPESLRAPLSLTSPETVGASEGNAGGGKDWWWKQDNYGSGGGGAENGAVKDYVMEWIGTEIKKERPKKSDWMGDDAAASTSGGEHVAKMAKQKKKNRKRLEWWVSLDEEKEEKVFKKVKRRKPREWWREEYCEELEKKNKRKKKKKREMGADGEHEDWWPRDEELYNGRKKKRSRRSSRGSVDWFSGELFRARRNSHDSVSMSGDIPESGGISSTPSMRGTVCYVAPEYCGGGVLSEKSDVYSLGVLLLVLIAGRRPLQVASSPMSEFQRANLMHWARNLARAGKLLDLVDQNVVSLDKEQAVLCITVALLCLQKSPARRPSMKEVVAMLTGEAEVPQLPIEFSPSTPSRFPFKSHKRVR